MGIVQTGFAYCFYFDGIGKLPIQTSSILGYIEPALAVILSMTVLKQPISPIGILGAIFVIGGAIASEIVGRKQFINYKKLLTNYYSLYKIIQEA